MKLVAFFVDTQKQKKTGSKLRGLLILTVCVCLVYWKLRVSDDNIYGIACFVVWWIVTEELSALVFRIGRAGSSETSKTTKHNVTACKTVILIFIFVPFSAVYITNFIAAC